MNHLFFPILNARIQSSDFEGKIQFKNFILNLFFTCIATKGNSQKCKAKSILGQVPLNIQKKRLICILKQSLEQDGHLPNLLYCIKVDQHDKKNIVFLLDAKILFGKMQHLILILKIKAFITNDRRKIIY